MKLLLPKIPFRQRRLADAQPPYVLERKPVREHGQEWIPACVCDRGCIPPHRAVAPRWLQLLRWTAFALVMLTSPALLLTCVLPERMRSVPVQWYAHLAVAAIGVRIRVRRAKDLPSIGTFRGKGELWASVHTSWLDAIVLHGITRATYVARGDLMGVPVVRSLAKTLRMIPINRERLRDLPGLVSDTAERIDAGERVVVFPEATTWCGQHKGRFHPAFFEAAATTGGRVRPISIWYSDGAGTPEVSPCFVLQDNGLDSLRRIVSHPGIRANIWIGPALAGTDRRELAELAEGLVFGKLPEYAEQDVRAA